MDSIDVRIVRLEPTRVASVHAFGPSPEEMAMRKLIAWASPRGLLDDRRAHRVFGFNNPDPSPGSPNYGYEFWITVGAEVETEGEVEIKAFEGGLYAVAQCPVTGDPNDEIPRKWRELGTWVENSRYQWAPHQWLEEHIGVTDPETMHLGLYCPITETA